MKDLSSSTKYFLIQLIDEKQEYLIDVLKLEPKTQITLESLLEHRETLDPSSRYPLILLDRLIKFLIIAKEQDPIDDNYIQTIESRIFSVFGFKIPLFPKKFDDIKSNLTENSVTHLSDCLNTLLIIWKNSSFYLGTNLTHKYFIQTRANHSWSEQFIITQEDGINCNGNLNNLLSREEKEVFEQWIADIHDACNNNLNDFDPNSKIHEDEHFFSNMGESFQ